MRKVKRPEVARLPESEAAVAFVDLAARLASEPVLSFFAPEPEKANAGSALIACAPRALLLFIPQGDRRLDVGGAAGGQIAGEYARGGKRRHRAG